MNQTYIHELLGGSENIEELVEISRVVNLLLGSHGYKLHKCCTNFGKFMTQICESENFEYDLSLEKCSAKVLGLKWKLDFLGISVPFFFIEWSNPKEGNSFHYCLVFQSVGYLKSNYSTCKTFNAKMMA